MDELLTLVKNAANIAIIPSYRLDADCMGSSLGLKAILDAQGKKSTVVYSGANAGRFNFLAGADQIVFRDLFEFDFTPFDLAIFLDGPVLTQFYDFERHRGQTLILPQGMKTVSIDHHESEEEFADLTLADSKAGSTAELIDKIFVAGKKISLEAATALFVGISGDTGHFRNASTTAQSLKAAADLVELGVDVPGIYDRLYNSQNYKAVQFSGSLISRIKIDTDYRYAYYTSPKKDWTDLKLSPDEASEASTIARDKVMLSIEGIDFCFTLKEEDNNIIKGSLRTRGPGLLDMNLLSKIISPEKGGGHKDASGFTIIDMSLEEAEKYVRETIQKHYNEIKL